MSNSSMLDWLRSQAYILEAWREEIASRAEFDLPFVEKLENHYAWLTSEIMRLEGASRARRL